MGECGLEALYRAWLPVWPLHDDIEVICSASHTFVFRFVSLVHPLQDPLLLEALAIAKAQRAELVDSDAEVLAGEVDTGDNTVLLERAVVTAVREGGVADRVAVDFTTLLDQSEGCLVGCSAKVQSMLGHKYPPKPHSC